MREQLLLPPMVPYKEQRLLMRPHDLEFRSEPAPISREVDDLTSLHVLDCVSSLSDAQRSAVIADNTTLLCVALTCSDEWGRPYKTSLSSLTTILETVSAKPWNMRLTKAIHMLEKTIRTQPLSTESQIFHQYMERQLIFDSKAIAMAYVLGTMRFIPNPTIYDNYLRILEDRQRRTIIGEFKPPANLLAWADAIEETIQMIHDEKISPPALTLTPEEKMSANMLQAEFVHEYMLAGNDPSRLLPQVTGAGWLVPFDQNERFMDERLKNALGFRGKYDPSNNEEQRLFSFCLKTALHASQTTDDQTVKGLTPAEEIGLKAARNSARFRQYVHWVALGKAEVAPHWFYRAVETVEASTKQVDTRQEVYEYLAQLPKQPKWNVRFYYAEEPEDIPSDMSQFNPNSVKFTPISIDNLDTFNRNLTDLFGNPGSDNDRGKYVARAIERTLKNPESLRDVPGTGDWGFQHLRKLDVAKQKVSVHANWTTKWDASIPQHIVLTAHQKNKRRTATGR